MKKIFSLLLCLCTLALHADELEPGLSLSHFYDARSIFTNPAALGYQSELNGSQLTSSVSYSINDGGTDAFSLSSTYGWFGAGFQRLLLPYGGMFKRYTLGFGMPITPSLYSGLRYSFNRSESNTNNNFDSFDAGLQYHLNSFFSLGFLASEINQSTISRGKLPVQFGTGVALRPLSWLTATADFTTPSDDFAKTWTKAGYINLEPLPGFLARAGYHSVNQWQFSLQLSFGNSQLFSDYLPTASQSRLITGANWSQYSRASIIPSEKALKLEIPTSLQEEGREGTLFVSGKVSLYHLLNRLWKAAKRTDLKKIVLRLDGFPLGLQSAHEVYQALEACRKNGMEIEVFMKSGGIKEYLIASVAHKIHLDPGGELRFLGLKSERYFIKGTLDKLGVEAEVFAKGKYKAAPEMYTQKKSSEPHRETTLQQLSEAEKNLVPLFTRYRKWNADWKTILNKALLSPQDALEAKLVDKLGNFTTDSEKSMEGYRVLESLREQRDHLALPNRVAVLPVQGDILDKSIALLGILGSSDAITPTGFEKRLKQAVSDPRTRAIVVRVSSPGGEILASSQLAALVEKAREKKPVVISMGDVAASGGYMLAAPGSYILAGPFTLTGSIGVFMGKANLSGLYGKLDLKKEILTHAPRAGLFDESRALNGEERKIFARRLDHYYDSFVNYVAANRKMKFEKADAVAQGRVWIGTLAKEQNLVDELGGLQEAVNKARVLAGLDASSDVWEVYPPSSLFNFGVEELGLLGQSSVLLKGFKEQILFSSDTPLYYSELGPLE